MWTGERPITTVLIVKPDVVHKQLGRLLKRVTHEAFRIVALRQVMLDEEAIGRIVPEKDQQVGDILNWFDVYQHKYLGMGRGPETPEPRRWKFSPGAKFNPGAPSFLMTFTFDNRKDAQIDQNHANIRQKYRLLFKFNMFIHLFMQWYEILCFQWNHNSDLAKKYY